MASESVVIDQQTNQVSVINVLEDIQSPGFPLVISKLSAVFYLTREASDNAIVEFSIRFFNNEIELNRFPVTSNFEDKLKNRTRIQVNGLVIPNPGNFSVGIFYNDEELSRWQMAIQLLPNAQFQVQIPG